MKKVIFYFGLCMIIILASCKVDSRTIVDFRDLNSKPNSYLYTNLTVKGNVDYLHGLSCYIPEIGHTNKILRDSKDYYVYIKSVVARDYQVGNKYEISGVFRAGRNTRNERCYAIVEGAKELTEPIDVPEMDYIPIEETIERRNLSEKKKSAPKKEQKTECWDLTPFGECSKKGWYCDNGELVENIAKCGCPNGKSEINGECDYDFRLEPKRLNLEYELDGETDIIKFTVYKGFYDYITNKRIISDNPQPSEGGLTLEEAGYLSGLSFYQSRINDEEQREQLLPLVMKIQEITSDEDEQAQIAISLVQHIPYANEDEDDSKMHSQRLPYAVLYDMKGVCGTKSWLLTFLLKELEFGSALITFPNYKHSLTGIKCPMQYSFRETGYCAIEATVPLKINYIGTRYKRSEFIIYNMSEGNTFDIDHGVIYI